MAAGRSGNPDAVTIGPVGDDDVAAMLDIINRAAEAYRGVIPADRWHEPYMPAAELAAELADGVIFSGARIEGALTGVMGVQRRENVDLIRHAYVLPDRQGQGIGASLLRHLCQGRERPVLIGTWQAAEWAVRFYERHGFAILAADEAARLLQTYWSIPERQIATSVVLASQPLSAAEVGALIAGARRD